MQSRRRRQVGCLSANCPPPSFKLSLLMTNWQAVEDESDDDAQQQQQQRESDREDDDGDQRMDGVERDETSQLIKKLVRYALACEYSRTPIRRDGIKEKGMHAPKDSARMWYHFPSLTVPACSPRPSRKGV